MKVFLYKTQHFSRAFKNVFKEGFRVINWRLCAWSKVWWVKSCNGELLVTPGIERSTVKNVKGIIIDLRHNHHNYNPTQDQQEEEEEVEEENITRFSHPNSTLDQKPPFIGWR